MSMRCSSCSGGRTCRRSFGSGSGVSSGSTLAALGGLSAGRVMCCGMSSGSGSAVVVVAARGGRKGVVVGVGLGVVIAELSGSVETDVLSEEEDGGGPGLVVKVSGQFRLRAWMARST